VLTAPDRNGNPQQLPVNMDLSGTSITDVSMLGAVHTLSLSICAGISDVDMLGDVHYLDLRG
jgi:hypothetical protein